MRLKNIYSICEENNLPFLGCKSLHGGDINDAFEIETLNGSFFLKINDAEKFPGMFEKEADGLIALQKATSIKVPTVVAFGENGGKQYLILEWLKKGRIQSNSWKQLGQGMAQLHQTTSATSGWHVNNYIGSLSQDNKSATNWAEFYGERRIMPLVKILYDKRVFINSDLEIANACCGNLGKIFPTEPFGLLHGDLWSGNFFITGNGMPAIFDPAVYFGNREMDIGMTRLFGGFDKEFYSCYGEILPLEKDWRKRLPLTQLYPLLVHAVLFGGGYISQCRMIMKDWK